MLRDYCLGFENDYCLLFERFGAFVKCQQSRRKEKTIQGCLRMSMIQYHQILTVCCGLSVMVCLLTSLRGHKGSEKEN